MSPLSLFAASAREASCHHQVIGRTPSLAHCYLHGTRTVASGVASSIHASSIHANSPCPLRVACRPNSRRVSSGQLASSIHASSIHANSGSSIHALDSSRVRYVSPEPTSPHVPFIHQPTDYVARFAGSLPGSPPPSHVPASKSSAPWAPRQSSPHVLSLPRILTGRR
ncbi:hypothetical protein GALMADRAFT_146662 [Galerina marginata CBS 339.88]|uniref:Uncharacterized protein n=1 Tax=Galerina marginata (strain CBS 339.88) TaxID=685588 RepID=A0A067SAI2_GALM3|nr:hypothetical protein GALMADRAFT_146662 [Galerina marginata CBS 339.88]